MFNIFTQCIMNIDFVLIIDWVLRITGLLTLIFGFVSLFINHYEFDVNVYVDRINKLDLGKYKNAFEYKDEDTNGEYLLFLPQGNTNFKKVKYCEFIFTGKKFKGRNVIKCFKNINCANGIILNTYYPCGASSKMIEWEADYGVKGTYILAENGKDGDVKHGNFFYKYNLIANVRKIIGWK